MKRFGVKRNRHFKSSLGFSMVEAVIGLSILLVFFMMHINSYVQVDKARRVQSDAYSRMRVFQGLITIMGMSTTLRVTAYPLGNTHMFHRCVFNSAGSCFNPSSLRDIRLHLPPLTSSGSTAELSGAFTGTPAAPMYYSNDGQACDGLPSACPVEKYPIAVSTRWNAVCPPRADQTYPPYGAWVASDMSDHMNPEGIQVPTIWCARAHYIKIHYRFAPRAGGQQFKPVTGTLMVNAPAAHFSF